MGEITAEVLERLARRRRFAVRTLDVARAVCIERMTAKVAAARFGVNLSRIYAIRKQVLAAAQALQAAPEPARGKTAAEAVLAGRRGWAPGRP